MFDVPTCRLAFAGESIVQNAIARHTMQPVTLRPVTRTGRLDGSNWQNLGLILKRSNLFHPRMLTESFNLALSN